MNNMKKASSAAVNKLNNHFNKLMEKSDLYQAYLIGMGNGIFSLYEYVALRESIEHADKMFEFAFKDNDEYYTYFREAVEVFKKEAVDECEECNNFKPVCSLHNKASNGGV